MHVVTYINYFSSSNHKKLRLRGNSALKDKTSHSRGERSLLDSRGIVKTHKSSSSSKSTESESISESDSDLSGSTSIRLVISLSRLLFHSLKDLVPVRSRLYMLDVSNIVPHLVRQNP